MFVADLKNEDPKITWEEVAERVQAKFPQSQGRFSYARMRSGKDTMPGSENRKVLNVQIMMIKE